MKVIFNITALMLALGVFSNIKAEDKDKHKLTIGGRFMADAAYYNTDFTKVNSGFAIVEARIRTSFTYNKWFFYADFDFAKQKARQKDIYLRYNFDPIGEGNHSIRAGYFGEFFSLACNTSKYHLHFLTRPAPSLSMANSRELSIAYKYYDKKFFLAQGVHAEDTYNRKKNGDQGFSLSGRWLYKPFSNHKVYDGHIGISTRFAQINTGVQEGNVLKTETQYSSSMETKVAPTSHFLYAKVPWAKNIWSLSTEALFCTDKFFIRGEYLYSRAYKDRPDAKLFSNQLGSSSSIKTLKEWQIRYPIRTSSFYGFYVEFGHLLKGNSYFYRDKYGVLGGTNKRGDFEIVARYSYTNLNDITRGDLFFAGKNKFYPNGVVSNSIPESTSIGGGKLQTAILGFNYVFNKYAKVMIAYQFSNLDNVYFPSDNNFHTIQSRIMFAF